MNFKELNKKQEELLKNIKDNIVFLEELFKKYGDHWHYEDMIYRFYHQSYKCYSIQSGTLEIVKALKNLAPQGIIFNCFFEEIFSEGTDKKFNTEHNSHWLLITRPIIEAFFHAKFFLEMTIKYGKELEKCPDCLPSGWAALLYFYNLR